MPQSLVTPTVTPTKSASSSSAQEAKEHTPEKLAVESLSTQLTATNLNGKLDDARQSCTQRTREGKRQQPGRYALARKNNWSAAVMAHHRPGCAPRMRCDGDKA